MSLSDDLERIAVAAAEHAGPDERLAGVVAAEPGPGRRVYLAAFATGDGANGWLALDDEGRPIDRRDAVREAASIVVMCELAGEIAGGGDLEGLRARLREVRLVEAPPGIEDAEEAALALERAIGAEPRVASPTYLDAVGAATRGLEEALGQQGSPFAAAMRTSTNAVDAFLRDVEAGYKLPLD